MTTTRLFVRWKTRGHWSLWHITDQKRARHTLCGVSYTSPVEMTQMWVCDCKICGKAATDK